MKYKLCIILVIVFIKSSFAQDLSPKLIIKQEVIPSTTLEDSVGTYNKNSFKVGFAIPVVAKINLTDSIPKKKLLLFSTTFVKSSSELGTVFNTRDFYDIGLGLSFIQFLRKGTLLSSLKLNIFHDEATLKNLKIKPTGLIIYRYPKTSSLNIVIGANYSYALGSGLPIPLLGFTKTFSEKTKLSATLPLNFNFTFTPSQNLFFQAYIKPAGGISYLSLKETTITANVDDVLLRNRTIKLGAKVAYSLRIFTFIAEGGILGRNELTIIDSKSKIFSKPNTYFASNTGTAPYFSLGIQLSPPRKNQRKSDPFGLDWLSLD